MLEAKETQYKNVSTTLRIDGRCSECGTKWQIDGAHNIGYFISVLMCVMFSVGLLHLHCDRQQVVSVLYFASLQLFAVARWFGQALLCLFLKNQLACSALEFVIVLCFLGGSIKFAAVAITFAVCFTTP